MASASGSSPDPLSADTVAPTAARNARTDSRPEGPTCRPRAGHRSHARRESLGHGQLGIQRVLHALNAAAESTTRSDTAASPSSPSELAAPARRRSCAIDPAQRRARARSRRGRHETRRRRRCLSPDRAARFLTDACGVYDRCQGRSDMEQMRAPPRRFWRPLQHRRMRSAGVTTPARLSPGCSTNGRWIAPRRTRPSGLPPPASVAVVVQRGELDELHQTPRRSRSRLA